MFKYAIICYVKLYHVLFFIILILVYSILFLFYS